MISCWVDTVIQIVLGRQTGKGKDVWVWLDELESLGHLPTLGAGLTRGRKKGLHIVSGYQSYSQIVDVYGENLAETMLTNHRSNIVFAVGRQGKATAERMSTALGEHEVMRGEHPLLDAVVARRVDARGVAQERRAPRLVEGRPHLDPITEGVVHVE